MSRPFIVDTRFHAESEIILRYAPTLLEGVLDVEIAGQISRFEGFRLLDLPAYRGVRVSVIDETTRMKTGTSAALDGCITAAMCQSAGYKKIVFTSGGNIAAGIVEYAIPAGIECFFFCPSHSLYKLEASAWDRRGAHLIAVQGGAKRALDVARSFAEGSGVPLVPSLDWRFLAGSFRGMYIVEKMLQTGHGFNWFSQAMSDGAGPIGIYRILEELVASGELDSQWIPKLLGVQQASVSPIVSAWMTGRDSIDTSAPEADVMDAIEPCLANAYPVETFPALRNILIASSGDMIALSRPEFDEYALKFAAMLQKAGLTLTSSIVNGRTQFTDRAGVIAGAGVLKAIHENRIADGESILISLTSGSGPRVVKPARPEHTVSLDAAIASEVARLGGLYFS